MQLATWKNIQKKHSQTSAFYLGIISSTTPQYLLTSDGCPVSPFKFKVFACQPPMLLASMPCILPKIPLSLADWQRLSQCTFLYGKNIFLKYNSKMSWSLLAPMIKIETYEKEREYIEKENNIPNFPLTHLINNEVIILHSILLYISSALIWLIDCQSCIYHVP